MISLLSCALFGALPHSAATEADDSHQYPNIQFEEISGHENDLSGAPIKFPQVENKKAELSGYGHTGGNMPARMEWGGSPSPMQFAQPAPPSPMQFGQPARLESRPTTAALGMGPSMLFPPSMNQPVIQQQPAMPMPTMNQGVMPVQRDYTMTNPQGGVEEVKRAANLAMTLYNCLRKYMCDTYRVCNDPSFPPLGLGQNPMPRPTQPPQTTYSYSTRPQIMPYANPQYRAPNPSTIAGNGQGPNFQNPYPNPQYPAQNPSTIARNAGGPGNFQNPGWSDSYR